MITLLRPFIAFVFLLLMIVGSLAALYDLPYWLMPPEKKFAKAWRADLALLKQSGHFPKAWENLSDAEFSSTEATVQDWFKATSLPFMLKKNGGYKLQILAVHYIDKNRYGVMIQYNWIDLKTGNTVGELARTLKLGLIY